MREAGEWNRAARIKTGGIHIYVPKEEVERALAQAGLDPSSTALMVKTTSFKTNHKGRARILISIKEASHV